MFRQQKPSGASFPGALAGPGHGEGGTPGAYQTISISPAAYGWTTTRFGPGRIPTFDAGAPTVAHELAYTCAVWHHGDGDRHVAWTRHQDEDGSLHLFEETSETTGVEINLRRESGALLDLGDFSCVNIAGGCLEVFYLGVRQGDHSGAHDCLMRYDVSETYRSTSDPGVRYYPIREATGHHLCTGPDGTGVNGTDHVPQSRYGDAAANRGNCKAQICVNDLRQNDPKHNR